MNEQIIELDLNDINHREIAGRFNKANGIRWLIPDLAEQRLENEREAWEMVKKLYPDLEGKRMSYNPEKRELTVAGDIE